MDKGGTRQRCAEALKDLGFSELESLAYTFLVEESPATGYRVSQALNKPFPGIYRALESLEAKGAIVVADGDSRRCRAVPWRELLSRLERQFAETSETAAEALANLRQSDEDDRIYELRSATQVYERCRQMLQRANELVLADLYPAPAEALRLNLEASARNAEVIVKIYEELELNGPRSILRRMGTEIYRQMPGHIISLSVDGSEHLLAFLQPESGVHQAIWTRSALLADRLHEQLVHEFILTELKQEIELGADNERLQKVLDRTRHLHPVSSHGPSYRNLLRRFGLEEFEAAKKEKEETER